MDLQTSTIFLDIFIKKRLGLNGGTGPKKKPVEVQVDIVYKKIDVKAGRAGTQIGDKDDGRD